MMHDHGLGAAIRARRRTLRLDQAALAEIAGVSVHALSLIESGQGNPTWTLVHRLTEALGLVVTVQVAPAGTPEKVLPAAPAGLAPGAGPGAPPAPRGAGVA